MRGADLPIQPVPVRVRRLRRPGLRLRWREYEKDHNISSTYGHFRFLVVFIGMAISRSDSFGRWALRELAFWKEVVIFLFCRAVALHSILTKIVVTVNHQS